MREHYCEKHATKFTRKTKDGKEWYSHPYEDADGNKKWCNEDAKEVAKLPLQSPERPPLQKDEPTSEQLKPFDPTRKSIERQTALKASVEWCIAKHSTEPIKTAMVITVAGLFESYLDTGIVVKSK